MTRIDEDAVVYVGVVAATDVYVNDVSVWSPAPPPTSAVTVVGDTEANPVTGSSVNVTLPVGSAADDLCVVAEIAYKTYSVLPTGFTQIQLENTLADNEIRTSYKVLTGTDITNGYVTMPGDANFNGVRYQIWVLRDGVLDVAAASSQTDTAGNGGSVWVMPSVVTTEDNDLVLVACGASYGGSAFSAVPPYTYVDQSNPTGYRTMWAGHFVAGGAGPTGDKSVTYNTDYSKSCGTQIAFKEAP